MLSPETKAIVDAIVVGERQWKRNARIAHAKLRIAQAVSSEDREVWTEVLKRNGVVNERKSDNRRRNKAKAPKEARVTRRSPRRYENPYAPQASRPELQAA